MKPKQITPPQNRFGKGRKDASAISLFSYMQVNCQAPPEPCLFND